MGEDLGIYNTYKKLKYKQKAFSELNKELEKEDQPDMMEQPTQKPDGLTPEQIRMIMQSNQNQK